MKVFKVVTNSGYHGFNEGELVLYIGKDSSGHDMYRGYCSVMDTYLQQKLLNKDVELVTDTQIPEVYIEWLTDKLPKNIGELLKKKVLRNINERYSHSKTVSEDYILGQISYIETHVEMYSERVTICLKD